jgi:hypothetical protein
MYLPFVANRALTTTNQNYICNNTGIICDYIINMGDRTWFVADEDIYNEMTIKQTMLVNSQIYVKVESGSSASLVRPGVGYIMVYTKLDDLVFWTTYVVSEMRVD